MTGYQHCDRCANYSWHVVHRGKNLCLQCVQRRRPSQPIRLPSGPLWLMQFLILAVACLAVMQIESSPPKYTTPEKTIIIEQKRFPCPGQIYKIRSSDLITNLKRFIKTVNLPLAFRDGEKMIILMSSCIDKVIKI